MCCFSRPVRFVGGTRIFARSLTEGRQTLVYALNVELDEPLAMVLPLPVPPGPGEGAVSFVSLEGYDTFFTDLASAFPPVFAPATRAFGPAQALAAPRLEVHDVGAFEASFVPTLADFARLDERFRMPAGVWERLPRYADWGFAVFQLEPRKGIFGGARKQAVHPMAFTFPSREPGALFFPTVHVHDGEVHETAAFDHALYAQAEGILGATLGWTRSNDPLGARVDGGRAKNLVDPAGGGFLQALVGTLRNDDVWLRPPTGIELADLEGRGECHAFAVDGSHAYLFAVEGTRFERWRRTAQTGLGALARGLREGLRALELSKRGTWQLARLDDALLPPHFMNGDQLWSGSSYLDGKPAVLGGPGRVTFTPFTEQVAPQRVTLAFDVLPGVDRQREIRSELARLLDRCGVS